MPNKKSNLLTVATYNIHKGVQGLGPARRLEIHNLGLAIEQLELWGGERWYVQLEAHPEGLSQPQVPDWFGYRRIDRG